MDRNELAKILTSHALWAQNHANGQRADLSVANLYRANLWRANLSRANLSRADLSRADLSRADLSRADLSRADLSRANLSGADLSGANLSETNLSGADLLGANLLGANLSGANLYGANLLGADLPENFYHLTTTAAGYLIFAEWRDDAWRIFGGCRNFTIEKAIEHWEAGDYHTPLDGRKTAAAVRWFANEIATGGIKPK